MRTLNIKIKSGDKTCASAPGEFCQYMSTIKFGTLYVCSLFPDKDKMYTVLAQEDGWLKRCPACLNAETFRMEEVHDSGK